MTFYLGTHVVNHITKTEVPMFISYRQLKNRKKSFDSKTPVCIDSGGFSELSLNGKWSITPQEYVLGLNNLKENLGVNIIWAAQQDWMTESHILQKTGKTILTHQKNTVENLLLLRSLNCKVHIIPVLQGQTIEDYFKHFDLFEAAGIDLRNELVVGVGSICRRQGTKEIEDLIKALHCKGIKIHGFGVKTSGFKKYSKYLESADSLAWSFGARYNREHCSICVKSPTTQNCANCLQYALEWRVKVLKHWKGTQ